MGERGTILNAHDTPVNDAIKSKTCPKRHYLHVSFLSLVAETGREINTYCSEEGGEEIRFDDLIETLLRRRGGVGGELEKRASPVRVRHTRLSPDETDEFVDVWSKYAFPVGIPLAPRMSRVDVLKLSVNPGSVVAGRKTKPRN